MPGNAPNQSVQRAVRILFAVAGAGDGRTVNQIAAATGLAPATAYKFIRTLEAEHLLQRHQNPLRFFLGHAVAELKRLDDDRHLLTLAGRLLVRAQAQLPEASLALLESEGVDTYQRLGVFATRPGVLVRRREFRVHPYAKASSLLFLAYAHPDTAAEFFQKHPFERDGRLLWKTRARLDAFLADIRRRGYAQPDFPDHETRPFASFRLAVPVFSPGGDVLAALAGFIPVTSSARAQKRLVQLCRAGAAELSAGTHNQARAVPATEATDITDAG